MELPGECPWQIPPCSPCDWHCSWLGRSGAALPLAGWRRFFRPAGGAADSLHKTDDSDLVTKIFFFWYAYLYCLKNARKVYSGTLCITWYTMILNSNSKSCIWSYLRIKLWYTIILTSESCICSYTHIWNLVCNGTQTWFSFKDTQTWIFFEGYSNLNCVHTYYYI